jgi:hypothetical protein
MPRPKRIKVLSSKNTISVKSREKAEAAESNESIDNALCRTASH